jgi:hypothetical protein|tara:strand:+ start:6825 stop:10253 length:3429 start_codon:yes stop_codon:yes gene_type:complete
LLDIPRGWGTTSQGRWYRRKRDGRHDILSPEAFRILIEKRPIVISMSNHDGNNFTNFQSFAIFDFDNEKHPEAAKEPLKIISSIIMQDLNLEILHSDSGGKGYHIWLFFTSPIFAKEVETFQDKILERCAEKVNTTDNDGEFKTGFLKESSEKWAYFTKDCPYDKTRPIINKDNPELNQKFTEVEFLTSLGDGKMLKAILSKHPKYTDRYELPMTLTDIETHNRSTPITDEDFNQAYELLLNTKKNDYRLILKIAKIDDPTKNTTKKIKLTLQKYQRIYFKIPKKRWTVEDINQKIKKDFDTKEDAIIWIETHKEEGLFHTKDYEEVTKLIYDEITKRPCLYYCFYKSTTERSIFFLRANIVTTLSSIGYTRTEIGYFFRNEINDDVDNANRGILEYQVDYWCRHKYHCRCEYFQEPMSTKYCCFESCGRRHPAQSVPEPDHPHLTKTDTFKEAYEKCEQVIQEAKTDPDKRHVVIKKTTRSGFTTAMDICGAEKQFLFSLPGEFKEDIQNPVTEDIRQMFALNNIELSGDARFFLNEDKKRLTDGYEEYSFEEVDDGLSVYNRLRSLFLVPRTKIAEDTFSDTICLAREKKAIIINGYVISANQKSCLNRAIEAKKFEEATGKALQVNIPVPRDDCETCQYRNSIVTPGINEPIYKSITDGTDKEKWACATATIKAKRNRFNVGFATYAKLQALLRTPSEEIQNILNDLLNYNIIVMDEISQFVETAHLQLPIFRQKGTNEATYDFMATLQNDLQQFSKTTNIQSEILNQIEYYCDFFAETYKDANRYSDGQKIENALPLEIRTQELGLNMLIYLSALYKHHTIYPEHNVSSIYNALTLLTEDEWYISKVKTMEWDIDMSFVVPPKCKRVIDWLETYQGSLFISDATMPFQDLDKIFGEKLHHFYLGDPNRTAETQLIICDCQNIAPSKIFKTKERMKTYVNAIIKEHGKENFMTATSNKKTKTFFTRLFDNIPEGNITYYRSSLTIGVMNNLRAMMVVSTPYTPQNAFDWMAIGLGHKRSAGKKIWEVNGYSTFFQTISRVKDPEGKTSSVVYAFGIKESTVKNLIKMACGKPQTVEVPLLSNITNGHTIIAKYWNEHGRILGTNENKILILTKNGYNINEIHDITKLSLDFINTTLKSL